MGRKSLSQHIRAESDMSDAVSGLTMPSIYNHQNNNNNNQHNSTSFHQEDEDGDAGDQNWDYSTRDAHNNQQQTSMRVTFADEEEDESTLEPPRQEQAVRRVSSSSGKPKWVPWSPKDGDNHDDDDDDNHTEDPYRTDESCLEAQDHHHHHHNQLQSPYHSDDELASHDRELVPRDDDDADSDLNDVSEEQAMTEDIYSLMSTVPMCSLSFWFGVCTFIAQAAITCLVFLDLVVIRGTPPTTNGVTNRMSIPVDVPMLVTTAQFFGVGLIVNFAAAQGDLLVGFGQLIKGFDPEIQHQNPYVTPLTWYLCGILQFFVGAVLVAVLAVLLMQSTSNIMLCLNFAALHFVQDIDDVAFSMGAMGLLSRKVQKDCEAIGDIMVKRRNNRRNNIYKRIFLVLLGGGLYSFYFLVAGWQWTGRFMCHSVFVQFGDDFGKEWPHYSSVFAAHSTNMLDRQDGRVVYFDPTNTMRLAYCYSERAWTFSYVDDSDHCNYFIKSSETWNFDIMEIADRPWYASTEDLGDVPMDFLSLTCNDCNEALCGENAGVCIDNKCVCNDNRMGINCEFWDDDEHLCEFMALDRRTKGDLSALSFASVFMRKTYRRFRVSSASQGFDVDIEHIYNRPFYISVYTYNRSVIETFIVFSGYRWIMYGLPQEAPREVTIRQFQEYLIATNAHETPLHTLYNISKTFEFIPLFFSRPIEYETRSHDVDPLTARWVLAGYDKDLPIGAYPDIDSPVSAKFLCTKCHNETNPCFNNGICGGPKAEFSTQCDCYGKDGFKSYGGSMCEYAYGCDEVTPLHGCVCDKIFQICTECDRGWYGNLCQYYREVPEGYSFEVQGDGGIAEGHFVCEDANCQNGGTCINSVEFCDCPPEWTGVHCEIPIVNGTTVPLEPITPEIVVEDGSETTTTTSTPEPSSPLTASPTTLEPSSNAPLLTSFPTTSEPSMTSSSNVPLTRLPTTFEPSTTSSTSVPLTTSATTTVSPTTSEPSTTSSTTNVPLTTTSATTTVSPTTLEPSTLAPSTPLPTTLAPSTDLPSIAPSNLPSVAASDPPSTLPTVTSSDQPSSMPSNAATTLIPSNLPSSVPSEPQGGEPLSMATADLLMEEATLATTTTTTAPNVTADAASNPLSILGQYMPGN